MLGGEFRVSTAITLSAFNASDFWTKSLVVRLGFLLPSSAHAFLRYPSQSRIPDGSAAASPQAKHFRHACVGCENRPKHARLVYYLNRNRFHTLWTLLTAANSERTRAREVGKRKTGRNREGFRQKSLALNTEMTIAEESLQPISRHPPLSPPKAALRFNSASGGRGRNPAGPPSTRFQGRLSQPRDGG